ncbi:MAG: YciI family protein [Arcicella sp.]|nr:YciI family protein [Arcicella sp.]
MNQYLITAYDGTDENALERRMNVRPFHLEGAKKLKEDGNFIIGGAMLNEEGKMIGSTMILQFENPAELQNWIDSEPYIQQKVWEKFEVKSFRVANV